MDSNNKYTKMQKLQYENGADGMNEANHQGHNANPDYWNILLAGVKEHPEWVCFDFGCGCGRNVINLLKLGVSQADGGDISQGNLNHTKENIEKEFGTSERSKLYLLDGVGINGVPSDTYDFVMSTIVLQHICVYDIRFAILKDKYRTLKKGGMISFQMGLGNAPETRKETSYYENFLDAAGTNSFADVYVHDPKEVIGDLERIGFKDISYEIRPPFSDHHKNWIFFKAYK